MAMVPAVETMPAIRAMAAARAAFGLALAFRTEKMLRLMVRDAPPTGSLFTFARTVGVRDLVFGLGALVAARGETPSPELTRWVKAWIASDIGDVIGGATASKHMSRGGTLTAVAAPLPFIAAGVWTLRRLSKP